MDFSTVDMKRCTLVRLGGRIDGSVAPDLGSSLRALIDDGHYKLVLNMKDVSYTSSAGAARVDLSLEELQALEPG